MDDWAFRHAVYLTFAETGSAPTHEQLATWAGGEDAARNALARLHEAHALVLDGPGSIRMALPFSAVPTTHRVTSAAGSWWANCAWDALAIPLVLGIDGHIDAAWLDTGEPVELAVATGGPSSTDGFIHFAVPARHWWDDIVET